MLGHSSKAFLWVNRSGLSSAGNITNLNQNLEITNEYSISYPAGDTYITNNSISTTDITSTTISGTDDLPVSFPDGLKADPIYYDNAYEYTAAAGMTHHNKVILQDTLDVAGVATFNNTLKVDEAEPIGPEMTINGNLKVLGNVSIIGGTTSLSTQNLLAEDKFLQQNFKYVSTTPVGTGTVAVRKALNGTQFPLDGNFTATDSIVQPKVGTVAASGLVLGSFIQICGSTSNDGLYEVYSHAANILEIKDVSINPVVAKWSATDFTTEAVLPGAFAIAVELCALEMNSTGTGLDYVVGPDTTTMATTPVVMTGSDATLNKLNITSIPAASTDNIVCVDTITGALSYRTGGSLLPTTNSTITEACTVSGGTYGSGSSSVNLKIRKDPLLNEIVGMQIRTFSLTCSSPENFINIGCTPPTPQKQLLGNIMLYFNGAHEECYCITDTSLGLNIYRKDGSDFPAGTTITHCSNALVSGQTMGCTQFNFVCFA